MEMIAIIVKMEVAIDAKIIPKITILLVRMVTLLLKEATLEEIFIHTEKF